jgi:class 3 adenylate cyclase
VQSATKGARLTGVRDVEVRWAYLDGMAIAYEVFGAGPRDLLLEQIWSPIDLMWELPQLASFLDRLGGMARVIVFDALGSGASDQVVNRPGATVEQFADAALAVLDAVDAARVVLLDASAGMSGAAFTAIYPQRLHSAILVNLRPSYPEVGKMSAEQRKNLARALQGARGLELHNPRVAHDPELRSWWGRAQRLRVSPAERLVQVEWSAHVDAERLLPLIQVPTLVMHRGDNRMFDLERSRDAAELIPDSRFVELPGSESDLFLGDTAPVFTEIERFLAQPGVETTHDRPLATILFTDMVSSTERLAAQGDNAWIRTLDDHDNTMNRIVIHYRGRVVKTTGDGILATFDGPARAVRCAVDLLDAAQTHGIMLRAGLHTGEIELRPSDIAGIAVHIASRISALAGPNEVLVSRTVVDLTAGSGLQFEARGEHELKGVPGTWATFAANVAPQPAP